MDWLLAVSYWLLAIGTIGAKMCIRDRRSNVLPKLYKNKRGDNE